MWLTSNQINKWDASSHRGEVIIMWPKWQGLPPQDVRVILSIGCTSRTHLLALADLWLWQRLMEIWPRISPPRGWAPRLWPFTGPGWEERCQEPRGGATDPTTFPSVGDSCSAKEPGGRHSALPHKKDGQQLCLCGGWEEKSQMIHLWMSHSCKDPLHTTIGWPVESQDRTGAASRRVETFVLKLLRYEFFCWVMKKMKLFFFFRTAGV